MERCRRVFTRNHATSRIHSRATATTAGKRKTGTPLEIGAREGTVTLNKRLRSLAASYSRDRKDKMVTPSSPTEQVPLPAFLRQTKAGLQHKFVDLEWHQRERLAAGTQDSATPSQWARLTGDEVLARNRYLNVEPFASNRVKLRVAEGLNDYINASPILLDERRYIATQGPKDTSTSHFWRMMASETSEPAVIVMLTQTHESGREKCFTYFPLDETNSTLDIARDDDIEDDFEGQVTLVSAKDDAESRCTVRHMKLRTRGGSQGTDWVEKDIYHLLFSGWPDFGIPEGDDRKALTQLVQLSRKLNKDAVAPKNSSFEMFEDKKGSVATSEELNPRIVHCSAGVGRSGTFIALDYLLNQLETGFMDDVGPSSDPIAETVDKLRQQRMMMVQGESQFLFLYEALRELWIERWRESNRRK